MAGAVGQLVEQRRVVRSGALERVPLRQPDEIAARLVEGLASAVLDLRDRKSTRLNSSHSSISYAVFCLKKKTNECKESNGCPSAAPQFLVHGKSRGSLELHRPYALELVDVNELW